MYVNRIRGALTWKDGTSRGNMSFPFSTLSIYSRGVQIKAMSGRRLGRLFPDYDLTWAQIERVEKIVSIGVMPLLGVKLVANSGETELIFWTLRQERILQIMRLHG